jgi:hydrogenase nickel incorporation protein HypB
MEINLYEQIYQKNQELAASLRQELAARNVFMINVMGSPGIGKTSAISRLAKINDIIIEGDLEGNIDTEYFENMGIKTLQINTHGACHLDVPDVRSIVQNLSDCTVFIENIGNLICPAEFDLGEHIKVLIVSVTDGSDKPYKYPPMFEKADVILVNKVDLMPYVSFDKRFFEQGVRLLTDSPIFYVNAASGEGFEEVRLALTDHATHATKTKK